MKFAKKVLHAQLLIVILALLSGCDRETYTTWTCHSASETKIPMVLRKAQMEFKGGKLDYCGSLGNLSYFAQQCPAQIEQAGTLFTPSTGLLVMNGQEYQCSAL